MNLLRLKAFFSRQWRQIPTAHFMAVFGHCWFTDPTRALCLRLAGTPTAEKPLIGMCDSARCPQATHHACHRPVWAEHAERTKIFLGQLGKTRVTEHARLAADHDRALRVIAEIDAASPTTNQDNT
ncbi:hypothetical protein ACFLIM_46865 [Nonomuraea sp. M3C6]|uniref:Uncharacterized protein n=1 Tax=Nonomuraea marmarensis TaxID=3351344 RepID=A0ABW7ATK5_9ACTN